jgi:mannose-1-phosphate guanylyltransferase/mannose-6-phosphate isomerase
MRQIEIDPDLIALEPVGRNTAPALAVAALLALKSTSDPLLLVLPADHYIPDLEGFAKTVRQGTRLSEQGYIITFGIEPNAPETGYGYIRKGRSLTNKESDAQISQPPAWEVDQFVEKPDLTTAKDYLASGQYCWNSGMFMFKASRLLEELDHHAPTILESCRMAVDEGKRDLDFFRLGKAAFSRCPSDSIDYAVMEKTSRCAMVALDGEWNDLGSWEALWTTGKKDNDANVVFGDVALQDVENSFIHASNRLVAAVGLSHHVIVETKDAVFVAPRTHVQQVKALVDQLKEKHRPETVKHKKVYRPWGAYEDMDVSERFIVKRITVKPKAKLSLQKHIHRAEHWVVVKGTALVTKGDEQHILKEDQSIYIPLGVVHRLENPGIIPLELVEVQSGSYLGEDDVVRLDDVYGRHRRDDQDNDPEQDE